MKETLRCIYPPFVSFLFNRNSRWNDSNNFIIENSCWMQTRKRSTFDSSLTKWLCVYGWQSCHFQVTYECCITRMSLSNSERIQLGILWTMAVRCLCAIVCVCVCVLFDGKQFKWYLKCIAHRYGLLVKLEEKLWIWSWRERFHSTT